MAPQTIEKLLRKVQNGTCTEDELAAFHEWMAEESNKSDVADYVKDVWQNIDHQEDFDNETDKSKMWNEIQTKLHLSTKAESPKSNFTINTGLLMRVAAVVLPFIIIAVYTFYQRNNTSIADNTKFRTISTEKGMKKWTTLPDGSMVYLNSNSSISFATNFLESKERIVKMKGEAFFKVQKLDDKKPFKVIAPKTTVKVLGTSFAVRALPKNNKEYIAVLTGKVNVATDNQNIDLLPNEMVEVGDQKLEKVAFDPNEMFSWKDGILYYKNASIDEVWHKLENWYGVEFRFEGKKSTQKEFSGMFRNEVLSNVLEGLSFSAGFDYKINGKIVNIHFK
ncbi:FecR family protein [Chondrinema litorale]|uniref:FecR family protein n=1 Tax=Chondrinema litorale TaxID=2994555 RepID=UPI002543FB1C|nr:FecR family protein [Chondrinema litorale]UZR98123.1 FecR family protein [Chondrinema litorale]